MAKDDKGHGSGSGPHSYAVARVHDKYGSQAVPITKSKAKAVGNGFGHVAPGWRPMVHKDLGSAMAKLESHPGFSGWDKTPKDYQSPGTVGGGEVRSTTQNKKY